jgi:hypothetical protein
MLRKNTKTSPTLNLAESADIAREVKQHGFYSAFCTNMADAPSHDDLIKQIKKLALRAHLKVSFNATESICVFEVDDNV